MNEPGSAPELDCTCAYVPLEPYPLTMRRADPECPKHAGQPEDDPPEKVRGEMRDPVYYWEKL